MRISKWGTMTLLNSSLNVFFTLDYRHLLLSINQPHFSVGRCGAAVEGRGSGEDLQDVSLAVPRHHGDRHLTPGDRRQATDH
jgi:hypothetical protein